MVKKVFPHIPIHYLGIVLKIYLTSIVTETVSYMVSSPHNQTLTSLAFVFLYISILFFLKLDFHKGVLKPEKEEEQAAQPAGPQNRLPPLMPERDRDRERDKDRDRDRDRERERERDRGVGGVRDLWAEREREMERRERARGEREWDRDKIREFARPGEDGRRSRSRDRERRRRERARSKERKTDKKGKRTKRKLEKEGKQEKGQNKTWWRDRPSYKTSTNQHFVIANREIMFCFCSYIIVKSYHSTLIENAIHTSSIFTLLVNSGVTNLKQRQKRGQQCCPLPTQ